MVRVRAPVVRAPPCAASRSSRPDRDAGAEYGYLSLTMTICHFTHNIPEFRAQRPEGYSAHTRFAVLATGVGKPRPTGTDKNPLPKSTGESIYLLRCNSPVSECLTFIRAGTSFTSIAIHSGSPQERRRLTADKILSSVSSSCTIRDQSVSADAGARYTFQRSLRCRLSRCSISS